MKAADNTLLSIKKYFKDKLLVDFEQSEIDTFFIWCVEDFLGLSKIEINLNKYQRLSESEILKFHFAINQIKEHEPIQYILGNTWFYNLQFEVNSDVLIPRPETEELVDWILKSETEGKLMDIGTGSGCIAISLAHHNKKLTVFACDISEGALHVAKKNALKNNVEIRFSWIDILEDDLPDNYDVIVSNPPYIPFFDKKLMAQNVLDFEPELALFVDNDTPIIFYESIAKKGLSNLNQNGKIYFEVHEEYATKVSDNLKKLGYSNIEIKQDMQGKNRMIRGTLIKN
jgi:release factor glutamine methyltransferase